MKVTQTVKKKPTDQKPQLQRARLCLDQCNGHLYSREDLQSKPPDQVEHYSGNLVPFGTGTGLVHHG